MKIGYVFMIYVKDAGRLLDSIECIERRCTYVCIYICIYIPTYIYIHVYVRVSWSTRPGTIFKQVRQGFT